MLDITKRDTAKMRSAYRIEVFVYDLGGYLLTLTK